MSPSRHRLLRRTLVLLALTAAGAAALVVSLGLNSSGETRGVPKGASEVHEAPRLLGTYRESAREMGNSLFTEGESALPDSGSLDQRVQAIQGEEDPRILEGVVRGNGPLAVRAIALMRLVRLECVQAEGILLDLLEDRDEAPGLRAEAAHQLGRISRDALPHLRALLTAPESHAVRKGALLGMAEVPSLAAVEQLVAAATSPELRMGRAVVEALRTMHHPEQRRGLEEAAADPDLYYTIRAAACSALGVAGDPRTTETLLGLVSDPTLEVEVRVAAAEALGRIGDPSALPVLEAILAQVQCGVPALARAVRIAGQRITALTGVR